MTIINNTYEDEVKKHPFAIGEMIWITFVLVVSFLAWHFVGHLMDRYTVGILIAHAIILIWFGRFWPSFKYLTYSVGAVSMLAVWIYALYDNQISANEEAFLLVYLISSQSAIMWMCFFYILATVVYFAFIFAKSEFIGKVASSFVWIGSFFGLVGMMVRWRESYLIDFYYGSIPITNLYDAFMLFIIATALMYLYYEQKFKTRALGGFVMLIVVAAIIFVLWYTFDRQGYVIQPLVPALQSFWMKLHVPANFIGYGGFAIAAMVGVAYLITEKVAKHSPNSFFVKNMPAYDVMDDIMYRAIAIGFAFFTLATVLGAFWASEAWGSYWSWDPKESWSLITWLTYAGWLHIRMSKGWRGAPMCWWAIAGLFITAFTFIGVNVFLSGLHSYGAL